MNPERTYTIRQLCREFAVTPRALRSLAEAPALQPAAATTA